MPIDFNIAVVSQELRSMRRTSNLKTHLRAFLPPISGAIVVLFASQHLSQLQAMAHSRKGKSLYSQVSKSDVPWIPYAKSVEDRTIYLLELGKGENTTVIFGGFHGDELLSVQLVYKFAEYLYQQRRTELTSRVVIVPVLNPDGLVRAERKNANKVDINRNFPTKNWSKDFTAQKYFPGLNPASEPETLAAMAILQKYSPQQIISVHTPLSLINYDGPALAIAEAMATFNNYPIASDIGYPTPGSFGTYAGKERMIPTITLELPEKKLKSVWKENRASLWTVITSKNYHQ